MSEVRTCRCDADGCASVKRETNHWWCVYVGYQSHGGPLVNIAAWDWEMANNPAVFHACGEQCLHKLVTKLTKHIAPGGAHDG